MNIFKLRIFKMSMFKKSTFKMPPPPSHHGTPSVAAGQPATGEPAAETGREAGRAAAAAAAATAGAAPGAQASSDGGGWKHSHGSSRGDSSAHTRPEEVVRRRGRTPVSAPYS